MAGAGVSHYCQLVINYFDNTSWAAWGRTFQIWKAVGARNVGFWKYGFVNLYVSIFMAPWRVEGRHRSRPVAAQCAARLPPSFDFAQGRLRWRDAGANRKPTAATTC